MNSKKHHPSKFVGLHTLRNVSPARRKNLFGTWKGLVWPQKIINVPGKIKIPEEIRVNCIFKPSDSKVITGDMFFKSLDENRGVIENVMFGGFLSETDLEFGYTKKTDIIIGWGTIIFKMSHDARKLTGNIIGISSHTGEHFHSIVELTKGRISDLRERSGIKPQNPTIFIGHGRNKEWIKLKNYLNQEPCGKTAGYECNGSN